MSQVLQGRASDLVAEHLIHDQLAEENGLDQLMNLLESKFGPEDQDRTEGTMDKFDGWKRPAKMNGLNAVADW